MHTKLLPLLKHDADGPLQEALGDEVVFHSPVRTYRGRANVAHILLTIGRVLDEIDGERELVAGEDVVTLLTASYNNRPMTGVLVESHNQRGHVARATLLLRPLSALMNAMNGMSIALERSPLPDLRR
jgi:hypothetical protein